MCCVGTVLKYELKELEGWCTAEEWNLRSNVWSEGLLTSSECTVAIISDCVSPVSVT